MDKIITGDMLTSLPRNMQVLYRKIHPDGLTLEELAVKAEEHNAYRIIYNSVIKEVSDGE